MTTLSVQRLIAENNQKRALLTKENEAYYTDLLVYTRLQWRLSEKQSEEILMEMLDHLLDAQAEDKSAKEVFGEDVFSFADDLIEEIAEEKPRNIVLFLGGLALNLLGWFLVIRAGILTVIGFFTNIKTEINIFHTSIVSLAIIGFVFLNIWFIFRIIKQDLFKEEKEKQWKQMLKTGSMAAISMAAVLILTKFTPEIGLSFPLSPTLSFILGSFLLVSYYIVKKLKE